MGFGRRISNYFSIQLHNVQLIWTALIIPCLAKGAFGEYDGGRPF
jgi:hypothetical protein